MAEGGTDLPDSEVESSRVTSPDSCLLECPICLEPFHQPKTLPCSHCFCQECLSTYITKELSKSPLSVTSFPCPVCRRVTQPIDPTQEKEHWAEQFPTNNLIQELIELQKTQSVFYCKPCGRKQNMKTPAKTWCKSLNMFFCEDCKDIVHDVVHEDCNEIVIIGTDITIPVEVPPVVKCTSHGEKIEYYCEDHKILGCSHCMIEDHRPCKTVTKTKEYFEKVTNSSEQKDLLELLEKRVKTMEALIEHFSAQMQTLVKQEDVALKSIAEQRQKIDQCLDKIQKDLTDELITAVKQGKENMVTSSQKCEQMKCSMLNTVDSSRKALANKNILETILLLQRGQAEMEACKDLVMGMKKTNNTLMVKHIIDPSLKTVGKNDGLGLGKVLVEKQLGQLPDCILQQLKPMSEYNVKEVRKFSIKCPSDELDCNALGSVYLPDEHVIIYDGNNKKLKLYTDKGQYVDEMEIPGMSYDMCLMDDNTVAVSVNSPGSILIVKTLSSKLALSYSINSRSGESWCGITCLDGDIIVSTSSRIYKVTKDETVDILETGTDFQICRKLVTHPTHKYIFASEDSSTVDAAAVSRISKNSNKRTVILKVGLVKNAFGIDVDKEGNVYICGYNSNNVVQMSNDGANIGELLTSSDGVRHPLSISVCGDKFLLTNRSSQRNYVHVYQLY